MGSVDKPVKTREVHNHHQDSTIWNDFIFRDDDIVIATYAKSGTTWMQQILAQLIFKGDPEVTPGSMSPWVDLRVVPRADMLGLLEAQTHRRFMKTHLPADAMVFDPRVKYIFVALETIFVDLVEDDTRVTIPWPFWEHIRSWWAVKDQPNVLLVHFADLKKDLPGEMRRIAKFVNEDLSDEQWKAAVEHCSFEWMKEHADKCVLPVADQVFNGGAKSFINKGTNGRWTDVLSSSDNKRYLQKAKTELGDECAHWVEKGTSRQVKAVQLWAGAIVVLP